MTATRRLKWRAIVGWGLFVGAGFFVVGYWRATDSAMLLLFWLPILYGLASLMSGKREIVERLRARALWFAVSRPKSYEHGLGYGRVFEWNEDLVRAHAGENYTADDPYCFTIGSGLSWFSGDEIGRQLDFGAGVRENVLELSSSEARNLSAVCREFEEAAARCNRYFVTGWVLALAMCFFLDVRGILLALGICTWVVVWWGVLPARSLVDRTEDPEFLCPRHLHVYTHQPSHGNVEEFYYCVCGKIEKARDDGSGEP